MRNLESYTAGRWITPNGDGAPLADASTGDPLYAISSDGVDFAGAVHHGRMVGNPALR